MHPSPDTKTMTTADKAPEQPQKPVIKTDAEWRKLLTPEQYRIARQVRHRATEWGGLSNI